MAQDLYDAGLQRINISLDSLDPEIFDQIIGNRGRSAGSKSGKAFRLLIAWDLTL